MPIATECPSSTNGVSPINCQWSTWRCIMLCYLCPIGLWTVRYIGDLIRKIKSTLDFPTSSTQLKGPFSFGSEANILKP